ncbi:hypothetical protein ACJO2E_19770 [Marinobacter sp. M1N3S26]
MSDQHDKIVFEGRTTDGADGATAWANAQLTVQLFYTPLPTSSS